jgi:hypothetical protein
VPAPNKIGTPTRVSRSAKYARFEFLNLAGAAVDSRNGIYNMHLWANI